MPLLIDTYNVLHTVGVLPADLAGIEVPGLIDLLQKSRYRDEPATLVCDGAPLPGTRTPLVSRVGNVTVRYAGRGKKADDLIDQIVRASSAPRRLLVISSDHAILRAARRRRCNIMTSAEFLGQLAADAKLDRAASPASKPKSGMSDEQIERWADVFGIDEKTMAIPSQATPPEPEKSAQADSSTTSAQSTPQPPAPPQPRILRELQPGEEVPADLIAQAEKLWAQQHPPKPPHGSQADES